MPESKQSNHPLLSLIVPCYNVAPWIDRLLESVQGQTLTNFEVIAVNDGSTDATQERWVEWAQKDPRVRVYHQPNSGAWQARVVGITQARTDWITFADGDDAVLPTGINGGGSMQKGVLSTCGIFQGTWLLWERERYGATSKVASTSLAGLCAQGGGTSMAFYAGSNGITV